MAPQPDDRRDPVDIAVAARIRLARKMRGRSQQALAEAIGVTFQQVQKYESGANRVSASMLARIAAALVSRWLNCSDLRQRRLRSAMTSPRC